MVEAPRDQGTSAVHKQRVSQASESGRERRGEHRREPDASTERTSAHRVHVDGGAGADADGGGSNGSGRPLATARSHAVGLEG